MLAALGSFMLWGFFSIPLRNIRMYPSEEILYYRIFTSLVCICIAILLFRKKQLKADIRYIREAPVAKRKLIGLQILVATVFLLLNWYAFIYAINHVSLTAAAFAYMVCPLLTAFGGFIILKEELSKLKVISLLVALASIIFLGTGSLTDVLWSGVIALFYAGYLLIQRKMEGLDKLNVLAMQFAVSVLLVMPFYISRHQAVPADAWFWLHIILIAVVFTIVPLFLSLYALIGIPSSTVGILIYINPIVAFTVAILYFGEVISLNQVYAYLLLLFSVILFNWQLIQQLLRPGKQTEIK